LSTEFLTTREKIFLLLKYAEEPMTARDIMKALGIRKEKEVYDHIFHLAKSSKRKDYVVLVISPKCESCGYEFEVEFPKKPSRCPVCKSERISPPKFLIKEKKVMK